jgi:inorganic triphosphatase YgiF
MPAEPALEVELKFAATPQALVDLAAANRVGEAILGTGAVVDELDQYLDTSDRRLASSRWACRLRTRHGRAIVSLKGPRTGSPGAIHRRPELEGPAGESLDPRSWPPSAARARLLELSGGAPLAELVRLQQRRLERPVVVAEGRIGTLSLDEVLVVAPGSPPVPGSEVAVLRDVELELSPGAEEWADRLERSLSDLPGLRPERASKLERGLAAVEATAPEG